MERFLKSRYKTGQKLSENPFSVTYQGCFVGSQKPVIIKIYKRGTLNSSLIKSMKQKVKEFSRINHHGVAKLFDGDYGWQGFYYVREYVEGQTLSQVLAQEKKLELDKAIKLIEAICQALSVAHQKNIIHGALKPNNIFITDKGIVKLVDFVIEGEIKEAMPQKIIDLMADSGYVSPEELLGRPADKRSDIFSLGLIFYQLISGEKIFAKRGFASALQKLKSKKILLGEQISFLPQYLQEILAKSLNPEPLLRFETVEELQQSLEQKRLIRKSAKHEELSRIFEATVTRYGQGEKAADAEIIEDIGRLRIRWAKEGHRLWILLSLLAIALLSGLLYAFMVGR